MTKDPNDKGEAIHDMWLGDLSGNGKKAPVWMGRRQQSGPACSLGGLGTGEYARAKIPTRKASENQKKCIYTHCCARLRSFCCLQDMGIEPRPG
jgi:hypothetical protein